MKTRQFVCTCGTPISTNRAEVVCRKCGRVHKANIPNPVAHTILKKAEEAAANDATMGVYNPRDSARGFFGGTAADEFVAAYEKAWRKWHSERKVDGSPRTDLRHGATWTREEDLELRYRLHTFLIEAARDMGRSPDAIRSRINRHVGWRSGLC